MDRPDPDRIGKEHRNRIEHVKDVQRRAIENVLRPPDPKSCRYCKHYVKKTSDEGYCMLWKKKVKASDSCERFSRV